MKTTKILIILPLVSVFGCSSAQLTRAKAQRVIQASDAYKPQKRVLLLQKQDLDACVANGYLRWNRSFTDLSLSRTAKGNQFFESARGEWLGQMMLQPASVGTAFPLKPTVVRVTGITDGENGSKVVEYDWVWDSDGVPPEMKSVFIVDKAPNHGKAMLKLYDDGWRVEKWE
jgi:hypothetical protein